MEVAIPICSVALVVFGVVLWRGRQKRRHTESTNRNVQSEDDSLAFLQRKAELEAEERRRYELLAEDVRHELETREIRPELHGGVRRQELRGEEHSRELEAST